MYKLNLLFLILSLFLSACSSSKPEEFREYGRSISKSLIKQLEKIHSKEDLERNQCSLESLFVNLTEVMIYAMEYHEKHSVDYMPLEQKDYILSDKLRSELNRIYRLPGIKEAMEKIQLNALNQLDLYEQQLHKRKIKIPLAK